MRVAPREDGLEIDDATEPELVRIGQALAGVATPSTVIGLVGPLGAGKTTLSRAIAEALGVDPAEVSSPTFVLIHEYAGTLPIYHFDAYRLGGPEPFEGLGPGDYWEAGGLCLVEWADLVHEILPSTAWWLTLRPTGPTTRALTLTGMDPESRARLTQALAVGN